MRRPVLNAALITALLVAATASVRADGGGAQVNAIYPDIDKLYVDLHKNPELAFHEKRTAATLAARVKALGYAVTTGVGGTGIVAVLKSGAGPVAVGAAPRADVESSDQCRDRDPARLAEVTPS
ncbi:MAG: hypothetical protein ABJE66_10620 [Deltaproteobacteria bacterium]